MKDLNDIINEAQAQGLPFLIIGGQAVKLLGYERVTRDFDFVVLANERRRWEKLLARHGYGLVHATSAFAQFKRVEIEENPIDLMLVDDSTFAKLSAESTEKEWEGARGRVPVPLHLIAMKLHALKSPHRYPKDYTDIVELMRIHKLDIRSPEFQAILARYAPPHIRERLEDDNKLTQ